MMKRLFTLRFWVLVCHCMVVFGVSAQNIRLNLDVRAEDAHYTKLILVSPVFAIKNDSVANPLDISSAKEGDPVTWYSVKLPSMESKYRKGYCWLFDGSSELKIAKSYTLVVLENPGMTIYRTRIWVDKNHNLDLTDDGPGDTITVAQGTIMEFGHNNGYKVLLEHFPAEKFIQFSAMNNEAIRKLQGSREFLGTDASLREKRLNVIAANWNNGVDSFCLGLKDANCNGIYNEEEDVALITNYKGVFDNLQGVRLINGKAYLEWNGSAYEIKNIDPQGRFIDLFRDTVSRLKYSLNVGDKMPRFKYCTATKPARHKSIRRLKGQFVYVYVWRDGLETFYSDSANWHSLGRLNRADFLTLGLNYGGSARYVFQYNKIFETQIKQGYSSNDVNAKLMIKQIPTGILLDKNQRIIATGLRPGDVERVISDYLKGQ